MFHSGNTNTRSRMLLIAVSRRASDSTGEKQTLFHGAAGVEPADSAEKSDGTFGGFRRGEANG